MEKCHNGKYKSTEDTKSLQFILHSNNFNLNIKVTDIVLFLSPQLHPSPIVIQNSTQRCTLESHPVGQRIFIVVESISYSWKSHSICARNFVVFFCKILPLFSLSVLRILKPYQVCLSAMEYFLLFPNSKIK